MKRVVQEVACVIEIGIPRDLVLRFQEDSQLWSRTANKMNEIKALGECEVLFWNGTNSDGYPIKDFDYYQYEELKGKLPVNETYEIRRFYVSCVTPEYDIFGMKDMEAGKPGKSTRFWFKGEDNILFLVKATGRNAPEERDFLNSVELD